MSLTPNIIQWGYMSFNAWSKPGVTISEVPKDGIIIQLLIGYPYSTDLFVCMCIFVFKVMVLDVLEHSVP